MLREIHIFGLVFHTYGFILGCAVVCAVLLIEKKILQQYHQFRQFWQLVYVALGGGVLGARAWHVATDFWLYKDNLLAVFYLWNGGLSILGGIVGGVGAVAAYFEWCRRQKKAIKLSMLQILDVVVFGLPFAQALGRVANFVNQELYGLPTNGPFKIYIEPQNRIAKYADSEFYHPLFLYEALAMVMFGISLWIWDWWFYTFKEKHRPKEGTYVLVYLLYYSVVRFFLDFLRVEKPVVLGDLGVNQLVLLGVIAVVLVVFVFKKGKR